MFVKYLNFRYLNIIKTLFFTNNFTDFLYRTQVTYKQAQAKYGIQGRSTVLVWLRKHGQQDWTSNMPPSSKRQLTPQQRIRQLEKQLAAEKLKTEFIQDVIYHIDKECGTDLGKKYTEHVSKIGKAKED